ncbi:carboxypeptidase-like regulatory domain-containing protein [Nocardioides montaniterrae]
MTDETLDDLLHRAVADVPDASPPVAALLQRGRQVRRRRRRTAVLGAAVACLVVVGGIAVARTVTGPGEPTVTAPVTDLAPAPAGTKWVGVGRQVIAVPRDWPVVPGIYCTEPTHSFVTITEWRVAVACEPIRTPPRPVDSIDIEAAPSGLLEVHDSRSDGVLPRGGHAEVRRTLPRGWLAVPFGEVAGGVGLPSVSSEIEALTAAGFRVERRTAPSLGRWLPVTTTPEIGTPARAGSTVIVNDHGAIASTATLTGRLLWVGGPAPGTARPHAGVVHVVNDDDSVGQTVAAGADGRWRIDLPPGTYRVMATSPGYLSAHGEPDACTATGPVTAAAHRARSVDVYCQLR